MVDMPFKNMFEGYNLMHNIVIMDLESTNRQFIARFLETPPRNGHDDHGHHGRHAKIIRVWGYNLMHNYVIMD